jgi:hypothetical protein
MLTLAEELLLLAYDEKTGGLRGVTGRSLAVRWAASGAVVAQSWGLSCAVVAELLLAGRLRVEGGKLLVVDATPMGDEWLDAALDAISRAKRPPGVGQCPGLSSRDQGAFQLRVYRRLAEKGILTAERRRIRILGPWSFSKDCYVLAAPDEVRRAKERLREAILGDGVPDARTVALIGLARGCGLLPELLTREELEAHRPRLRELTQDDPVRQAIVRSRTGNDLIGWLVAMVSFPALMSAGGMWGPVAWAGQLALLVLYPVLLLLYARAIANE